MGELRTREPGRAGARLIVAISGLPGAGKTTVADALCHALGADQLSFGTYVRELAAQRGLPTDRRTLQDLGDGLVRQDPEQFVEGALAAFRPGGSTIIAEGVRHQVIIGALRDVADSQGAGFCHVHLAAPDSVRRERLRARGHSDREARAAYQHSAEQESVAWLSLNADLRLDASAPVGGLVATICSHLGTRQ